MTTDEQTHQDVLKRLARLEAEGKGEYHPATHHGALPQIVLTKPVKDLHRIIRAAKRL